MKETNQSSDKLGEIKFSVGFSLVEILLVISIITLLASLIIPNLNIKNRALKAVAQENARQLKTALLSFELDHGYYPGLPGQIESNKNPEGWSGDPGRLQVGLVPKYIPQLPDNPKIAYIYTPTQACAENQELVCDFDVTVEVEAPDQSDSIEPLEYSSNLIITDNEIAINDPLHLVPAVGFQGFTTPDITEINPQISFTRTTGTTPFVIQVSAMNTTAGGVERPYEDLEYKWNFGDPAGTEIFSHPVIGTAVNANQDQTGPEAAYVYRQPGTYTVTLSVRAWDGEKFTNATKNLSLTVHPWTGETRYLDPNAPDSGNGATALTPWNDWDTAATWVSSGDNRQLLIRRGSEIYATKTISLIGKSGIRLGAYGSGPRPIIYTDPSIDRFLIRFFINSSSHKVTDNIIQDLVFDNNGQDAKQIYGYQSPGLGEWGHIYVLDSKFQETIGGNGIGASLNTADRMGFWNTEFSRNNSAGQSIFAKGNQWFFAIGTRFSGGNGNWTLHHHIYPNGFNNVVFRWLEMGPAKSLNFCLNNNSRSDDTSDTKYWLIDGVDCYGTRNGFDFSTGGYSNPIGRFNEAIVQNSALRNLGYDQSGGQGMGLYGERVEKLTVRDNIFYGNRTSNINISSDFLKLKMYRNSLHTEDGPPYSVNFKSPQALEIYDNKLVYLGSAPNYTNKKMFRLPFTKAASWLFDLNTYWSPNQFYLFYDNDTGEKKTFNQWQAVFNFDLNGAQEDPGWINPGSGNFSTN